MYIDDTFLIPDRNGREEVMQCLSEEISIGIENVKKKISMINDEEIWNKMSMEEKREFIAKAERENEEVKQKIDILKRL